MPGLVLGFFGVGLRNLAVRGEVDAGIVGRRRFVYEILGGCVADARRLANTDAPAGIRMTSEFEAALGDSRTNS